MTVRIFGRIFIAAIFEEPPLHVWSRSIFFHEKFTNLKTERLLMAEYFSGKSLLEIKRFYRVLSLHKPDNVNVETQRL